MSEGDPFGTGRLRESVLAGWRSSPTRFREDANAEEDLYLGGYRDRLLVELAQNAADAATVAGIAGVLRLSVVDGELRAANTGAALDSDGVAALASLRASAKRAGHGVGRFGVGFAAVLTVSDAPRVVSSSGGVQFSAERTADVVAELAERGGRVPVLRLVWPVEPTEPPPPDGFDTEVRLPLRAGVEPGVLLEGFADQVVDLLLALPGLTRIEVGDAVWYRTDAEPIELHGPDDVKRWLVWRDAGELDESVVASLGVEAQARPQWTVCWAVRVGADGRPQPLEADVLHAPTPTDERMSLPARLIATLPIEPSRRRLRPGPAADAVLTEAARGYPELVRRLEPTDRTALVPRPDFPLSEVDGRLRDLVLGELRTARWLPAAGDAADLAPARATIVDLPSADLPDLLADVTPGLLDAELAGPSHVAALAALDVPRLGIAELVAAVTGIDRPPSWWRRLYQALSPLADVDATVREELGGLPVPLADGRTLPGPRAVLLVDESLLDQLSHVDIAALAVVHPDAAHPLLERLGARRAGPVDLLDSAPLREAVERSIDDAESGVDIAGLVDLVARLVREAGVRPGEHRWLGALALPDAADDWRRADELAMPGSAFLDLLEEDSPIGVLAERIAAAWPATVLAAIGVMASFVVVDDDSPTAPDHDLADEQRWWDEHPEPPAHVLGVRDLDLIADDAWPQALRLLANEPETWRALHQQGGHTAWWIGQHATIAGAPPTAWRLASARALAGLYDPVPDIGVDESVLRAIGVRATLAVDDAADAEELLARLGDPTRAIPPAAGFLAHAELANADVDPEEIDPPERVRVLTGEAVAARDCLVLDAPWLLGVLPADRIASAGTDFELAEPLAELLDVPLAGEEIEARVESMGEPFAWAELGAVVAAAELAGVEVPDGGPIVHEELTVRTGHGKHTVSWWVDPSGAVHCADSADGLARAFAWLTGRWSDRHTLAALIADPEPGTHLG